MYELRIARRRPVYALTTVAPRTDLPALMRQGGLDVCGGLVVVAESVAQGLTSRRFLDALASGIGACGFLAGSLGCVLAVGAGAAVNQLFGTHLGYADALPIFAAGVLASIGGGALHEALTAR